jgi:hypothetical protein
LLKQNCTKKEGYAASCLVTVDKIFCGRMVWVGMSLGRFVGGRDVKAPFMSMLHDCIHAACPCPGCNIHTPFIHILVHFVGSHPSACPRPCPVNGQWLCSCCKSMLHVHVLVHAACPYSCGMFISMLYVHVHAAFHVHTHAACLCCMSMCIVHAVCPCPFPWTRTWNIDIEHRHEHGPRDEHGNGYGNWKFS